MLTYLVVTVTGADRPGIVHRVTEVLVANGGNLEESRMARLGGEFAAIMLVTVPENRQAGLKDGLDGLTEQALHVTVKSTAPAGALEGYVPYEVLLSGADHQGIVHSVADFLAGQGINIESLDTETTNAPETGAVLFSMRALVQAPPAVSYKQLEAKLIEIGDRLGVDIELKPA